MSAGVELFARYALAPNALGYCGPPTGLGATEQEVRAAAPQFSGAWPYLQVLARLTRTEDPLAHRLVEAYWMGRDLGVDPARFGTALLEIIRPRVGPHWDHVTPDLLAGATGDHGFHVFTVYPWSELLRLPGVDHPRHVLDRCRIRWGTVLARTADGVDVESRHLTWDGTTLYLSDRGPERIEADHVLVDVEPGDTVALHWEWLCDRITADQLTVLERSTKRHLAATTHRLRRPRPRDSFLTDWLD